MALNPHRPVKPQGLSKVAALKWTVVVAQLDPEILTKADSMALEILCETFSRWHEAVAMRRAKGLTHTNSQGVVIAPWVAAETTAAAAYFAQAAKFGLTPDDRGEFDVRPEGAAPVDPALDTLTAERDRAKEGRGPQAAGDY
ncbi:P27 family phage terminase small subunit [Cryobacterium sp. SO1]|uniref:P27 family phage terminase small subunit n=1 Tax=Cryobacterium sp. SO1 TaxID=1897061 RepID=UPI001022FEF7|nr:P27 family phage terminase small subunit [Cryobacterium sp. SO1]RZI35326.1 hypothetical protein BJQ95_02393 [Cryobacterium sp. SO1]